MGTVSNPNFVLLSATVTVGYQLAFFVITALLKIDKLTDFAGSTNFVIVAILTLVVKGSWHFRQVVLSLLVVVWGLRLGVFLLMRVLQWGEDRRFDKMRNNLAKLAVFWTLQALWVWTTSLPLTIVNASDEEPDLCRRDFVGWAMWLLGIIIEATADQQKLSFKNSPANRGRWCNIGLWRYSRHPNYFGEIFLWWGIYVASTPVLGGAEGLVILGPIFITVLLLFVSGIPLLEASADKKFGTSPGYRIYKRETSPLIPLPGKLYKDLPEWLKTLFLFEFPLYSRRLPREGQSCEITARDRASSDTGDWDDNMYMTHLTVDRIRSSNIGHNLELESSNNTVYKSLDEILGKTDILKRPLGNNSRSILIYNNKMGPQF